MLLLEAKHNIMMMNLVCYSSYIYSLYSISATLQCCLSSLILYVLDFARAWCMIHGYQMHASHGYVIHKLMDARKLPGRYPGRHPGIYPIHQQN